MANCSESEIFKNEFISISTRLYIIVNKSATLKPSSWFYRTAQLKISEFSVFSTSRHRLSGMLQRNGFDCFILHVGCASSNDSHRLRSRFRRRVARGGRRDLRIGASARHRRGGFYAAANRTRLRGPPEPPAECMAGKC